MILGISQPTFLPWIGYFAFLDSLDKLVFLDNVQFDKRSWQQRNNIKLHNQKHLITVPVKSKGKFSQKISDVEIFENEQIELIKKKIFFAYKKAKYFSKYYQNICNILDKKHKFLFDLNIDLIKFFIRELDIKIVIDYSSDYSLTLKKENLIFEICKKNNCKKYLTTIGSKSYLDNFKTIPGSNIQILYYEYEDIEYTQLYNNFIPRLSIIDLLFNEGKDSIKIIRNGLKIS